MPKWIHILSDIDKWNMTASCAHCGVVKISPKGPKRFRCSVAVKELARVKRAKNPEKSREYHRKYIKTWALKNPKKMKKYTRKQTVQLGGMNVSEYESLLKKQHGVCAICKGPQNYKRTALCIDHDHKTGAVRGLLCCHCNFVLGHAKDNIQTLSSAVRYLKKYQK